MSMRKAGIRMVVASVMTWVAVVGGSLAASAQEVSPGQPACMLPPVTLPLFDATPAAAIAATPAAPVVTGDDPPAADAATIGAAIDTIVACINNPDPALQYAVFTDRYLAEQLADDAIYQPEFELQLAAGSSTGTARFTVDAVEDIAAEADGRVGVTVTLSADGQTFTDRLILAWVDGDWLIDDVELLEPAAAGPRLRGTAGG